MSYRQSDHAIEKPESIQTLTKRYDDIQAPVEIHLELRYKPAGGKKHDGTHIMREETHPTLERNRT